MTPYEAAQATKAAIEALAHNPDLEKVREDLIDVFSYLDTLTKSLYKTNRMIYNEKR